MSYVRRVRDGGRSEGVDGLNNNMRMSDENALIVHLSGGSEVVGVGVYEVAGIKVADGNVDSEILIGRDGIEIGGILDW